MIPRHRTAIGRNALSKPLRFARNDGILAPGMTVLDYGCGRGSDVAVRWYCLAAEQGETATLEAKLAKARNIKQGMMQELLTGRIRLV